MMEQAKQQDNFEGNIYNKLFGGEYKQVNGERFSVSFVSVMKMKDFQLLLVCGALIVSADRIIVLLQIDDGTKLAMTSYYYFTGSCLAFLAGGIYHDTLFQGRPYFTIAVLCTVSVVWQFLFVTTLLSFQGRLVVFLSGFTTSFI